MFGLAKLPVKVVIKFNIPTCCGGKGHDLDNAPVLLVSVSQLQIAPGKNYKTYGDLQWP
jgi:hypothetical protein